MTIDFVDFRVYHKDMKKNKNSNTDNSLVSKKYLDKVLDEKLENTKGNLKKYIDERLETTKSDLKKYVDDKFVKNTSRIIGYVDMRFKSVDEKLEKIDKKLEMLDSILKTLDWLAKDYRDLKDGQTIQSEQYRRLDGRVTTLEKRALAS